MTKLYEQLRGSITVLPEKETEPEARLIRVWVGVVTEDNVELVTRRSVILVIGQKTNIKLMWSYKDVRPGSPVYVGLYPNRDDLTPKHRAAVTKQCTISNCDDVTLIWWVQLNSASDL